METRQKSVPDLAYETLKQIDPHAQEISLFEATQEEYYRDPQRALAGAEVRDRAIGSGLGIGEIILTPILLWIGGKLLDLAWDLVKRPLEEELSDPVSRLVRSILQRLGFGKPAKPQTFPNLTPSQKDQLRQMTLTDGELQRLTQRYGLAPELTTKLVDVMVTQIPAV